ncbi:hypothetical protein AB751O23_DK_00050, partial [Chlamydiales bacterium SCGC AB-751-O23]
NTSKENLCKVRDRYRSFINLIKGYKNKFQSVNSKKIITIVKQSFQISSRM